MLLAISLLGVDTTHKLDCTSQALLMVRFYDEIPETGVLRITNHRQRDVCSWEGIMCRNGCIVSIVYKERMLGNFKIAFAPPTLTTLTVIHCEQSYEVETRMLPRQIVSLNLNRNRIFGELDLTKLPPRMVNFEIAYNHIKGPIVVRDLPESLKLIDLSNNPLKQHTLFYENLPPGLKSIRLYGKDTKIKHIYCMHESELQRGRMVFHFQMQRVGIYSV